MGVELFLLIAGIVAVAASGLQRIRRLERQVARLQDRLDAGALVEFAPTAMPVAPERPAEAIPTRPPPPVDVPWPPTDPAPPTAPPRPPFSIESLIGGKLPIWVGGAALVVAGFFLVRLSIESGLFGPVARVVTAALFSLALIAGGELARCLPAVRDDARVGQVLAGAGIASAYGTLYIAAAQYHLVSAGIAFLLLVAITAAALGLALRQGAPTAIMALIGGFAAPLVAGSAAPDIGLLLVYLAVFIAALFALAAHQGWRWLALAAIVAGFGWANILLFLMTDRDAAGVAAFVVALALGGTLAPPRQGTTATWLRVAPLVAGLLQLLVLAPVLDFSAVAWSFHLVLVAAALVLARRDPALRPAAPAAALLVTVLVATGAMANVHGATAFAALAGSALLAGSGIALSRQAPTWTITALLGLAGPVLMLHIFAPTLLVPAVWSLLEIAAGALAALLAWRHRDRIDQRDIGLIGGSAVAALLAGTGLATAAGPAYAPIALVPVLAALGWWSVTRPDPNLARLPVAVLLATVILAAGPLAAWIKLVGLSVVGTPLTYPLLPPLGTVVRMVALPALAAAALLRWPTVYDRDRRRFVVGLSVIAAGLAYTLAKQPLAIADSDRFLAIGFVERAAITLLFAAAGWALATRMRFRRAGMIVLALAVARAVWFDLFALAPLSIDLGVGSLPVLNAAVLLPAVLALLAWTVDSGPRWRVVALLLTLVAAAALVRQATHGTHLAGPVSNAENWGYSAALLSLAIVWLWRGLATHSRLLRVAALALLTAVTVKVFLIDVAALGGVLRILSLLALGLALIGIGWIYNRLIASPQPSR